MNIKKILTGVVALTLVAAISVGATLAYLTATDSKTNTFTVGKVGITLTETYTQNSKLIPGSTITKIPVVTVSDNSEDCYLRVKVTIPAKMKAVLENVPDAPSGWTLTLPAEGSNIYVYTKDTKASKTNSFTIFESLTVKSNIDNTLFEDWAITDKDMSIVAEAIQSEGFATPALAWAAFDAQKA